MRYFFYIGGNDSAETCRIVSELRRAAGYDLRVIHVPKTIDNDLLVTDHTPGYGSAAKFVVSAFAGLDLDNFAIPGRVHRRRHGAQRGLPHGRVDLRPPVARPTGRTSSTSRKRRSASTASSPTSIGSTPAHGRCVAAVCEGVVADDGEAMLLKLAKDEERDPFGNLQLSGRSTLGDALSDQVKAHLKIKRVRCDTFGYLQRSFLGVVSPVDVNEARDVGETAVHFAVRGYRNGSVAIRRTGDYSVDYFLTPLESVAANTKALPQEYIVDGHNIADSFKDYARPLMGPLPQADRLIAPAVGSVAATTA